MPDAGFTLKFAENDLRKAAKWVEDQGQKARTNLGHHVLRTAINIRGRALKGIKSGSKSGELYEWEPDLPGAAGEGPVHKLLKGWDSTEYEMAKEQGYTVMLRMPGKGGQNWLPVKKRHKPHQASAPGEFPATDSGQLMSHIVWRPQDYKTVERTLQSQVGALDLLHPKFLEEGTKYMAERPWLQPAMDMEMPAFKSGLNKLLGDR